ncbi:DNA-binding protein [Tenacibaculum aestuarii]
MFIQVFYDMEDIDRKYLKEVGKNISRIRKSRGYSQLDICAIISMEKSNLSSIENGRQNPATLTLKRIADAIGVEVKSFFEFDT